MFVQARPWTDCDRSCNFCYLKGGNKTDIEYKRKSLMRLAAEAHTMCTGADTFGLIGGELFAFDDLYSEWTCVAESIVNKDSVERVFLGTHLLSGIDNLLDFAFMLNNKEVQICTSYDTSGRFVREGEYEIWLNNIKEVQDEGYKVVVSATLTDSFIHDTSFIPPEGTDFKLQPYFISEAWLKEQYEKKATTKEYCLALQSFQTNLPKRADVLRYFETYPDIAKDYASYDGKHAGKFFDYDGTGYVEEKFVCSLFTADCGHPYIAYCYADSDECTMCDAKKVIE